MNTSILKEIGLTDSEIDVYLSLFELGECSVSAIAKKVKKHRTNIYDILEKLTKNGLVVRTIKNNVRCFTISSLHKLEEYLHKKEKEFIEKEDLLKKFIKEASSSMAKKGSKERNIEVFEGIEGLRSFYYKLSSLASNKDEVLIMGSVKKVFSVIEHYLVDISKKSIKLSLRGRMIASSMIFKSHVMKIIKKFVDIDIRFISPNLLSPTAVVIFKDFVGFFNYIDEPFTMLVQDKLIADSYRIYFENMWKSAK